MSQLSTVTRKGQVTIPIEIRRALGIEEGDKVTFALVDDTIRLTRLGSVVRRTAGMLKGAGPTLSAEELREAAEAAIAEDVVRRSGA